MWAELARSAAQQRLARHTRSRESRLKGQFKAPAPSDQLCLPKPLPSSDGNAWCSPSSPDRPGESDGSC